MTVILTSVFAMRLNVCSESRWPKGLRGSYMRDLVQVVPDPRGVVTLVALVLVALVREALATQVMVMTFNASAAVVSVLMLPVLPSSAPLLLGGAEVVRLALRDHLVPQRRGDLRGEFTSTLPLQVPTSCLRVSQRYQSSPMLLLPTQSIGLFDIRSSSVTCIRSRTSTWELLRGRRSWK